MIISVSSRSFSDILCLVLWFGTYPSVSSFCLPLCVCFHILVKATTSPSLERVALYRKWINLAPALSCPSNLCDCLSSLIYSFFLIFLCLFYFWKRETDEREWGWGRERGRHRIWSCQHKPWAHDLSWSQTLNRLSHAGAPSWFILDRPLLLKVCPDLPVFQRQ